MNSDCFRVLRQRLMEKLDLARELSDEEILEEIDDLLLNGTQEEALSLREKIALRQELFYSVRKLDVLQELSRMFQQYLSLHVLEHNWYVLLFPVYAP